MKSVRTICTLLFLQTGLMGLAAATDQKPEPNICKLTVEEAAALNVDSSTDIHALSRYQAAASAMIERDEFDQLDCLASHARLNKERFSGGMWKLHALYAGLQLPVQAPQHPTEEDWNARLRQLKTWTSVRPDSVTALVALASTYINYGWAARGDGYSNTVSNSGWSLFQERTTEALRILEQAARLPEKCPEWYLVMLSAGQSASWDVSEMRRLYDEGMKFEPGYYYYARMLANDLLPKWSGEEGDAERFTQEAADRMGGPDGDILYFQVASFIACGCQDAPQLSWERIVKGFEETEKRYGVSMVNLNLMAHMAATVGKADPVLADKLISRIGTQWDEETWRDKEKFESAKKWAAAIAPRASMQRVMEGDATANEKTAEGIVYKAAFEKRYRKLVEKCVRAEGGNPVPFQTFTNVGPNGTVKDVQIFWTGAAAICVYQKLHTAQKAETPFFPAPPHAPYWVRLDLNGAEFGSMASR